LLFNKFFPIIDTYLICEDIARQSCAMVPRWQIFGDFLRPVFSARRVHVSDLHYKFALRPHHVWKYGIDIQSATAEIRRVKKERRKKKKIEITGQKYNGLPYYIGRP